MRRVIVILILGTLVGISSFFVPESTFYAAIIIGTIAAFIASEKFTTEGAFVKYSTNAFKVACGSTAVVVGVAILLLMPVFSTINKFSLFLAHVWLTVGTLVVLKGIFTTKPLESK